MDKVIYVATVIGNGYKGERHTFVRFTTGGICSCGAVTGVTPSLREDGE